MSVNITFSKGGGGHGGSHSSGIAHATAASHFIAHGSSSNPGNQNLTGRKLTENESLGVFITLFTFIVIGITAMAWSGE